MTIVTKARINAVSVNVPGEVDLFVFRYIRYLLEKVIEFCSFVNGSDALT